ncbi:MAG: alpha/beta hydrolase [Desulfobacteraceae bacterium]|nr:alpha/beta hydrolase [Desulfobacteraceae bacterium]
MMVTTASADRDIQFPVQLRAGSAVISATIFENSKAWCTGATILAVHGLTGNAASWQPLVDAMYKDGFLGRTVKRVIAIDLPGHGKSPMPENLPGGPFGNLLIDDNISVIMQSIIALQAMNLGPRVIMGHSMGGLAIQGLQEALLKQDLSLAHLGIFRAVLLAPVPAASSVWTQGPPSDISPFVKYTPSLGTYIDLTPEAALYGGSFTVLDGSLVPNAPSLADTAAYNAPEPYYTVLQLVGILAPQGFPRPDAREGAFSICKGTLLNVISFSQDVLVPAGDLDDLYNYLTGNTLGLFYRKVDKSDACHSMLISNPAEVVKALKTLPPM